MIKVKSVSLDIYGLEEFFFLVSFFVAFLSNALSETEMVIIVSKQAKNFSDLTKAQSIPAFKMYYNSICLLLLQDLLVR